MSRTHTNTEGQRIFIGHGMVGGKPVEYLSVHNEHAMPMLLDEGTRRWLLEQIAPGLLAYATRVVGSINAEIDLASQMGVPAPEYSGFAELSAAIAKT